MSIFSTTFSSISKLKTIITDFVRNDSSSKSKTRRKYLLGSLFERVQKIDKYVDKFEKSPLEALYPKTMKRGDVYIPPDLRCGALGVKLGLTHLCLKPGPTHTLCTMIQIKDCEVLQHIHSLDISGKFTRHTLVVGGSLATPEDIRYLNEKQLEYFQMLDKPPMVAYRGFTGIGTKIGAIHFTPGQLLKIVAVTKDKGFLGVMQRWGFKGQPASHGVSKYHRGRGSLCNLKARVAPRTKMAGHTGLQKRFVNGVKILRINTKYNVLYIKGSIPGSIGQVVVLRDCWKNPNKVDIKFPTFTGSITDLPEELFASDVHDPSKLFETEK